MTWLYIVDAVAFYYFKCSSQFQLLILSVISVAILANVFVKQKEQEQALDAAINLVNPIIIESLKSSKKELEIFQVVQKAEHAQTLSMVKSLGHRLSTVILQHTLQAVCEELTKQGVPLNLKLLKREIVAALKSKGVMDNI